MNRLPEVSVHQILLIKRPMRVRMDANHTVPCQCSFRKRTTKRNWKWLWKATRKHCAIKLTRKTFRSLLMHSSS